MKLGNKEAKKEGLYEKKRKEERKKGVKKIERRENKS